MKKLARSLFQIEVHLVFNRVRVIDENCGTQFSIKNVKEIRR